MKGTGPGDSPEHAHLAMEPGAELGIGGELRVHRLERDPAALAVERRVHRAHVHADAEGTLLAPATRGAQVRGRSGEFRNGP